MDGPTRTFRTPQEQALRTPPFHADERLLKLYHLWQSHGWHEDPPDRSQLPLEILQPWFGHISVFQAIDECLDFQLRLDGTSIVTVTGEDWTRRKASEIDRRFNRDLTGLLQAAIRTRRSLIHAVRVFQHEHLRATRLLLPVRSVPLCEPDQVFLVLYLDRTEPTILRD
jgi:hypothetical protein